MVCTMTALPLVADDIEATGHDYSTKTSGYFSQEAYYKKVDETCTYTKFLVWVIGSNNNFNVMDTTGCFGAWGIIYINKADKRDSIFFLMEARGDCATTMEKEWLPDVLDLFKEDQMVASDCVKDMAEYNSAELFSWFDEFEQPEIPNLEISTKFQNWISGKNQTR